MNRKGIELTLNFIVTIILGLAILGLGMVLLRQFVGGAEDIKSQIDEQTDAQLESLLQSGQPVAIPLNRATITRGDQHIFGLGIRNIDDTASFDVAITISTAVDKQNQPITNINIPDWIRYERGPFTLEKNELKKTAILVSVPNDATAGTYIFNVNVDRKGNSDVMAQSYGGVQKFWVSVP